MASNFVALDDIVRHLQATNLNNEEEDVLQVSRDELKAGLGNYLNNCYVKVCADRIYNIINAPPPPPPLVTDYENFL